MESLPLLFIVTSLILIITPGQDMILVMSRSSTQGWKAGVTTAAGVSAGLIGHTILATLGLGALLQASGLLFTAVKLIGAAYLVYLGIKMLRNAHTQLDLTDVSTAPLRKLFIQGAISNISNPKITIFYFAFLPQFVPTTAEHPTSMLFMLGIAFSLLTFLVKGPIGYGAGVMSSWMFSRPSILRWINRLSGIVLIALGLRLAMEQRN